MARNTGPAVGYSFLNITGQATTVARTGSGILHTITFNKPTATQTVAVYDNTAGSGTLIGTITVPASPLPVTLIYDAAFDTGLTIVTATANSDITVTFI
jgi:hypothetical protein